ncbi:hypothetical protein BD779DRAFT_343314 [Infundibulicybe gibba]|nr:hypothetical protein BD779DRAFT_343314 [Infundibulicybe gibba]
MSSSGSISTSAPPSNGVTVTVEVTALSSSASPSSSPTAPSSSASPSPPPTRNGKSNASIPVGAIVGGVFGGMVVSCFVAFLLWRHSRPWGVGHRERIDTTAASPYITPFSAMPSGPTMVETNNRSSHSPMAGPPESNPLSSPIDPGTAPRTRDLNGRKVPPRTPRILRVHEDSGVRGVTDEIVDVPPSYTSQ